LWYHATVDCTGAADDTEAVLPAASRAAWFVPYETGGVRAGFHYTRLGGGNRVSLDTPAGTGTDAPVLGYNRQWNLGAGLSANRDPLPANYGRWPNPIRFHVAGTNLVAQNQSNSAALHYQWARPALSNATVTVFLDADLNPFNGNEWPVGQWQVPGTTANQVGLVQLAMNLAATNAVPGVYALGTRITGAGRTRYLYAPESLTVVSSFAAPRLALERVAASSFAVEVRGNAGQRVVLERSADLRSWQPLATNWLGDLPWRYVDPAPPSGMRAYRAVMR